MHAYPRPQQPPWLPFMLILLTLAGLVVLLITLGVAVAAAGTVVVTLTTVTVKVVQRLNTPAASPRRPGRRSGQARTSTPGARRTARSRPASTPADPRPVSGPHHEVKPAGHGEDRESAKG